MEGAGVWRWRKTMKRSIDRSAELEKVFRLGTTADMKVIWNEYSKLVKELRQHKLRDTYIRSLEMLFTATSG